MNQDNWQLQHFYNNFIPNSKAHASQLCSALGWKIFTIKDGGCCFSHYYVEERALHFFFTGIKECRLSHLTLDYNGCPSICKSLSDISFSNLQILSLSGNQIDSLEPLVKINTSQLNMFLLEKNNLTSIKPLAKMDLQNLVRLSLNVNYITDLEPCLTLANCSKLQSLEACGNPCCSSYQLLFVVKSCGYSIKMINLKNSSIVLPKTQTTKKVIFHRMPQLNQYYF